MLELCSACERSVVSAQVLDVAGCDDEDGEPDLEQCIDDGSVAAFGSELVDTSTGQQAGRAGEAGGGVLDHPPDDLGARGVDDGDGMVGDVQLTGAAPVGVPSRWV
ncbi:hypothetical protein [Kineococcus rubinsiae]|uniref:hypothetical protein n=1 Tax=Kineococcus rubinsiae TaxID=2609562 RepID=UPI0014304BB3|nr:hypothetical protein [Kineococcus rubinsiae]NIZ90267.1 hypothetical protein [Kineococcus rubinsiae]